MPTHPSDTPADAPARLLADRFELIEILGRGGMATVWRAHDRRLGRTVAIKRLRPDLPPAQAARIEREARAAARIEDPRVVTVLDLDHDDDGTPFLVMQAHGGRTLADELQAGPLPLTRVRRLVDDLTAALAAAHACGVLHRDLKPANVLADPDGFRLTDFGIASLDDENETRGDLLGTLAYVAPERFDGAPATTRADVFSLGVVVYEALTGVQPFRGAGPGETIQRLRTGLAAPLPDATPPDLVALVERAVRPDPARRPPDGAALRELLGVDLHAPTTAIEVDDPTERLDLTDVLPGPVSASVPGPAGASVAAAHPPARDRSEPVPASQTLRSGVARARATAAPVLDDLSRRSRRAAGDARRLARENLPAAIAMVFGGIALLVLLASLVVGATADDPPPTEPDAPLAPAAQVEADLERIEELGR